MVQYSIRALLYVLKLTLWSILGHIKAIFCRGFVFLLQICLQCALPGLSGHFILARLRDLIYFCTACSWHCSSHVFLISPDPMLNHCLFRQTQLCSEKLMLPFLLFPWQASIFSRLPYVNHWPASTPHLWCFTTLIIIASYGKIVVLLWVGDWDDASCSCSGALWTSFACFHMDGIHNCMLYKSRSGHPGAAIMDSPQSPDLSPVIQAFGVSGRTRFSEHRKTFKCDIKIKRHTCCFSPLTPTENNAKNKFFFPSPSEISSTKMHH